MFQINLWGAIFIILILFVKTEYVFYVLIFTSALTTISFVNIGDNSILVYHIIFIICAFKVLWTTNIRKIRLSVSGLFYIFVLWCLITIPFSLLHKNTIVHNIDGADAYVRFSFQQITQFCYLLLGFITALICNTLLLTNKISIDKVNKYLTYSYVFVLIIALLQHILPVEFVNTFLRNAVNVGYKYRGSRISGTFGEPSMLSLYCAPMFGGYLYRLFSTIRLKYFILSLLFVVVTFDNYSSSGILGITISLLFICAIKLWQLYTSRKVSNSKIILFFLILLIIGITIVFNLHHIYNVTNVFISKIRGEGISGSSRQASLIKHINIGMKSLLPTGFGTVRSYDLLSTWLCSIGIIGLFLYVFPVMNLCIKLFKSNNMDATVLLINIMAHNIIMAVSVPEFGMISMWIYYGMAYYFVCSKTQSK